jgi:hypothetical protein
LIFLLGIAVKAVAPDELGYLVGSDPVERRVSALESVLRRHGAEVVRVVSSRQNSFTAARRFLVPQVLLGAYFCHANRNHPVNFLDLGTGLGILPRQLNSRSLYEAFSSDLSWPDGVPSFRQIPLRARFGADRGPLPDRRWVSTCYGPSDYYSGLYKELLLTLDTPEVRDAAVKYEELDILDSEALASFISRYQINAVNICYVLYELEPARRDQVIETLAKSLYPPGVVIVTEPRGELTKPGCTVAFYDMDDAAPMAVCAVSDGHFVGHVSPLDDYDSFTNRYPIAY